jgi:hypothetical protein
VVNNASFDPINGTAGRRGTPPAKLLNEKGKLTMKSLTIELKNHEGRHGAGYRSLSARDLNGKQIAVDISGMNPVDFIEVSIGEAVKAIVANGKAAQDITVNLPSGVVLGVELSAHLAQKFEADPLVNSITFS